eukprot:TRINITY_DN23637_c0_g1_i1.p1 TRINITY_DN23637_c0_g1~~TRINITY_DN23637_c0_g1_i1.p1  ORF type:complete len:207 (-),score=22.64 TRINITY_DN23637_c0_g1_i1:60-680(-)
MGSRSGSAIGKPRQNHRKQLARVATAPELSRLRCRAPRSPNQLLWWSEAGHTALFPPSLSREDLQPHSLEDAKPGPTFRDHEKAQLYKWAWRGSGPFSATSDARASFTALDRSNAKLARGMPTFSNFKAFIPPKGAHDSLEVSDYSSGFKTWSVNEMAAARGCPVFTPWHSHTGHPPDFSSPKANKRLGWRKIAELSSNAGASCVL